MQQVAASWMNLHELMMCLSSCIAPHLLLEPASDGLLCAELG